MKNFTYPQRISKLVLAKARIHSHYKQKNRSSVRAAGPMRIINYLSDSKYRKALLSKHARRRAYTIALIGIPLSLSGCMGIYEGGFECPPGKGVGCKSISEVNHMVDQGELPPKSPDKLSQFSQPSCEYCGTHREGTPTAVPSEKPKIWYPSQAWEEI